MAPEFGDRPIVMMEQGGTAEAAINGINETNDSMTNTAVILVADRRPAGEMALE